MLDEVKSSIQSIKTGMPQGSIVFFIIVYYLIFLLTTLLSQVENLILSFMPTTQR